jgi:hypothetical protein
VQATFFANQCCLEDALNVGSIVPGGQDTLGIFESIVVGTGADLRGRRDILATLADVRRKSSKEVSTIDLERIEGEKVVNESRSSLARTF